MRPAVEPYREALEHVAIEIPTAPVYSSATAEPFPTSAAGIRDQLAGALVHPVRWRETIDSLHRLGVRNFVEAGPGKALIGMLRRSHPDVEANALGPQRVAHA
jgi:malonyl CoA-acyl carrier protein transacylase